MDTIQRDNLTVQGIGSPVLIGEVSGRPGFPRRSTSNRSATLVENQARECQNTTGIGTLKAYIEKSGTSPNDCPTSLQKDAPTINKVEKVWALIKLREKLHKAYHIITDLREEIKKRERERHRHSIIGEELVNSRLVEDTEYLTNSSELEIWKNEVRRRHKIKKRKA